MATFKELHETYERPRIICGIYKITNNQNQKVYIGKSNNIGRRISEHLSQYEQKRTPNKPLYLAFNKYGQENFSFEVLEECSAEELNEKEKYWIEKYDSTNPKKGYNILLGGDGMNANENHPNHKLSREDVIDIRTRYANHERAKEVEALYKDKIGHSGFTKVWRGYTWCDVMPEVYTPENKEFHKHNTGQKGSANGRAKLNEEQVREIRRRRDNGEKQSDVYEDYRFTTISKTSFAEVWNNVKWKDVI